MSEVDVVAPAPSAHVSYGDAGHNVLHADVLPPGKSALRRLERCLRNLQREAARLHDGLVEALEETLTLVTVGQTAGSLPFNPRVWSLTGQPLDELLIHAEDLNHGVQQVATKVLEQLALLLAAIREDKTPVSRHGSYRNKVFKHRAMELGLHVEYDATYGYQAVGLDEVTQLRLSHELAELEAAMVLVRRPVYRVDEVKVGRDVQSEGGPDPDLVPKYISAHCSCVLKRGPRTIRVARGSWEPGLIWCRRCNSAFADGRNDREEALDESRQGRQHGPRGSEGRPTEPGP